MIFKRRTSDFKYLYKGDYNIRLNKGVIDHVTGYENGYIIFSEPYDKVAHKRIVDLFEEDLKGLKI